MLYIIFITIIIVVVFFRIKNSKFKSNIKTQDSQKTISPSVKVTSKISSSTKQEELELFKNYKKIIFFSLNNNIDINSDILYISAIKIGFNLKTGEIIYLEELKNTNNLQELANFSKDTIHFVSYNTKLYNNLLNLGTKVQFCTMLTNVSTVGIKNSHGRNRWPKLLEISKYYGIKFNNNLNISSLNNIKLNIQIFQKMLKHPKTSIVIRDFIFNNKSFLNEF
ncbi:MAG: hypothetical protein ACRC8M_13495 [Cetobacterium sp.]|uniref:hypothetical protein n=1 Tax=Cetobacterium sp. TaxID=2071632 RepID=UPI003F404BAC